MPEILGALQLTPGTTQAGALTNGIQTGSGPMTDEFLAAHRVEITLIGEPTERDYPTPFRIAAHSIRIDGKTVYTFD